MIGIVGNNLNGALMAADGLARRGVDATAFGFSSDHPQDQAGWIGLERPARLRIAGKRPEAGLPWVGQNAVRRCELHQAVSECTALVLREDAPSLFLGDPRPKVFWSQGADLQVRPFLVSNALHGLGSTVSDDLNGFGDIRKIARQAIRLALAPQRQVRQRRGLMEATQLWISPYQIPLVESLRLRLDRVRLMPNPVGPRPSTPLLERELFLIHAIDQLPRPIFFHPTRVNFLRDDGDVFKKDNDKLLRAFREYCHGGGSGTLVLCRKGRPSDLTALGSMLERFNLNGRTRWIPESRGVAIRRVMELDGVVVLDQFSPRLPSLGSIGREAGVAGAPLVTSYDSQEDAMYASSPPFVFPSNSEATILEHLWQLASWRQGDFESLASISAAWCRDNISIAAVSLKMCQALTEVDSAW